jgi:hypothetical protein
MIQESLKAHWESVSSLRKNMASRLRSQLDQASAELKKVLREMGADVSEPQSIGDIVAQIRQRNPSLSQLATRLDVATYDLRQKLRWNANMMSAYVVDKAGKTYRLDVELKLYKYRNSAESRAKTLIDQVRDFANR